MDIKKLFGKTSLKSVSNIDNKVEENLESVEFLVEKSKDIERVEFDIDFTNFSNFARYGSAEKYVIDSFQNIYQNYPYDGSRKEKQQWVNNLSMYDKYIYDNVYPKATGYINLNSFSQQYVFFKGGPHAGTIFDINKNRNSNLQLSGALGNTVEFWLKRHSNSTGSIFNVTGTNDKLQISLNNSNQFEVQYMSGATGLSSAFTTLTGSSAWNYYAFSFIQSGSYINCESYLNGEYHSTISTSATLSDFSNGGLKGYIGARSSSTGIENYLSCSIDEFRFWKEKRTEKDIASNYLYSVYGGTDTDDSNTNLGVYFKFNEGIIDSGSTNVNDRLIRDYSGRISNGLLVNYDYTCRSTGSVITYEDSEPLLQYFDSYTNDYKLPTSLQIVFDSYVEGASEYDLNSTSNIINSIPNWIVEEADNKNKPALRNLVQIIAREFDNAHLYIQELKNLKNIEYVEGDRKPLPFNKKLLTSNGLDLIDLFQESSLVEEVLAKNDNINFENNLQNIKNLIYKNIYNNLSTIYKSKGTEKSFRNMLRSIGIDNEIVKVNIYPNNDTVRFEEGYEITDIKKNYLDFSKNNYGTFYQSVSTPIHTSSNNSFNNRIQYTFECGVLFDDVLKYYELSSLKPETFNTSSIFGMRSSDLTLDKSDFRVYSVKPDLNKKSAFFMLSSSLITGEILTSSEYFDVYADSRWQLAVRVKDSRSEYYELVNNVTPEYSLELYGVNVVGDSVINEFTISTGSIDTSSLQTWLNKDKILYAGAERTSVSSSVLVKSDAKVGSLRTYIDYLDNTSIYSHAVNPYNISANEPLKEIYNRGLFAAKSLILDTHFDQISSSDSNGTVTGSDYVVDYYRSYNYQYLSDMIGSKTFYGIGFNTSTDIVSSEIISAVSQKLPESLNSNSLINVLSLDDEITSTQKSIISHTILIEKSMYQSISDEMMNLLNSAYEFNNLIGNIFEKYSTSYKDLEVLRKLFFEKVQNVPDLEKYLEFYKWIDSSVFHLLEQLIPASATYSRGIKNLIESHIFERNKYDYKPNFFEKKKLDVIEARVTNHNSSRLTNASSNPERQPTGNTTLDNGRQSIFKAINRRSFDKAPLSYKPN